GGNFSSLDMALDRLISLLSLPCCIVGDQERTDISGIASKYTVFILSLNNQQTMKLIFVYNANSGLVNALIDIGHKAISPQTYACNLCDLTFGLLTENKQWKQFRETSGTEMEFFHKDEFEQQYRDRFAYPVILQEDKDLNVVISQAELNQITTLDELIARVKTVTKMSSSNQG
ncbi:MAG: hypothetical protein AAFY63_13795, partial [Cyanobacteria bacterium J06643_13]